MSKERKKERKKKRKKGEENLRCENFVFSPSYHFFVDVCEDESFSQSHYKFASQRFAFLCAHQHRTHTHRATFFLSIKRETSCSRRARHASIERD